MPTTGEVREVVKKLLQLSDTEAYDETIDFYVESTIEKLGEEGVNQPPSLSSRMYYVCLSFEVAKLLESVDISETRLKQLEDMNNNYRILLKDKVYE